MASCLIKYNILRILPENLEKTVHFYKNICGMGYSVEALDIPSCPYTSNDNKLHVFAYGKKAEGYEPTGVSFVLDPNHRTTYRNSGYWKIGIALRDVNAAVDYLRSQRQQVERGGQFYDVGFLTSFSDPNGYSIELLQHDFEQNYTKPANMEGILSQPTEIPPSIGQITIRCAEAKRTSDFYQAVLGMKLLCVEQPDNSFPFTLYFFAYTDDQPPSSTLDDVVNREWLYKKEYCQIEVQHRHNLGNGFVYSTNDDNSGGIKPGHVGFCVHVTSIIMEKIKASVKEVKISHNASGNEVCFVRDPDGFVIQVVAVS